MKNRIGLRNKLIILFTLVFLVPLLVFASSYYYLSYNKNDIFKTETRDFEQAMFALKDRVANNYRYIERPYLFNDAIKSSYKNVAERVILMDPYYNLLFDTDDLEAINRNIIFDDKSFIRENRNAIEYYIDITEDEYIFIYIVPNSDFKHMFDVAKYITFISIGLGFLVLLIMVIVISRKLSNRIIKPIVALSNLAEEISSGNLDRGFDCVQDDEIGRFCRVFNTMRINLKESLMKQEELEINRRELIAHISHDLRTPLTSIKGHVEILQDGLIDNKEKTMEYLEIIDRKSRQMEDLIDNLFTFSKMNLGEYRLEVQFFKVSNILHSILEDYVLEFQDNEIEFQVDIQESDKSIMVNYRGLSQVIDNLIVNSRRYALNTIKVSSHVYKEKLTIKVYDDGKKISENDIKHIFDPFYKVDKSRTGQTSQSGLGLAICSYVVNHFGGNIYVANEYVGKSFVVELPIIGNSLGETLLK